MPSSVCTRDDGLFRSGTRRSAPDDVASVSYWLGHLLEGDDHGVGADEVLYANIGGRAVSACSAGDDRRLLAPFVLAALQQVGVRLKLAMGPREFLAIDRVERPSSN
jgi:hypothetical protein